MRTYFVLLALLLASITPAMEISADKAEATFCPSSTQIFKITLKSTETSEEAVQISLDGDAAKWGTLSREKIQLPASGTEQSTLFVTAPPLVKPGTYKLNVNADGKTTTLVFTVAECFKLDMALPENISVCPSDSYTLKGNVTNKGKLMETLELSGSEFAKIEPFAISVLPSQKGEFTISLQVPSDIKTGKHLLNISAESQTSYAKADKALELEVLDCYNIAASAPAYAETCINEESTIAVNVTNRGVSPGTVTVNASLPDAKIANNAFYLREGETQEAKITLARPSKGQENMTVMVNYGKGETNRTITLINKDCHEFSVDIAQPKFICPCQSGFVEATINNLGKYADNFTINMNGLSDESNQFYVDGQSKKLARFQIDVPCEKEGALRLDITTQNSKYIQEKTLSITAPAAEECYNTTVEITPANITLPRGKGGLFNVTLHNFGMLVSRYVLKTTGANWSYIEPANITIGPNQTGEAYLYVSPVYGTTPGAYQIGLIATSDRVYAGEMTDVIVTNETYAPEAVNGTSGTGFAILSTKGTGYALAGIGLLIVVFVLYLVIWDPMTKEELNKQPEEKEKIAANLHALTRIPERGPAPAKTDEHKEEETCAAGDVKFSEVIYAPNEKELEEEKIRVHNTKNTSVDLSGWTLSDGEGAYKIPQNTIIPAKGHWTIFGSTYNSAKEAKGLALANKHNYVVLLDRNGKIIDKYSW